MSESGSVMDREYLETVVETLRGQGVRFEPGLTDAEVARVEQTHGFRFPPDLRAFLQHALPLRDRPPPLDGAATPEGPSGPISEFPDWRNEPDESLRARLAWPRDGIMLDVGHGGLWLEVWGPIPADWNALRIVAWRAIKQAPVLIPIFGHRYLPSEPLLAGNPVFSIMETDIIYYGYDLASYLAGEFGVSLPSWAAESPRRIRFWDDLLLWNSPDLAELWDDTSAMRAQRDALIRHLSPWRR
jgi:hypothetical protein